MNEANGTGLTVEDVEFFDNYVPALDDGNYTIEVTSKLAGLEEADSYFSTPISQAFQVRGPQFSLPVSEIHSCYPPINSNSTYDQYLPNLVFNRRILPWERSFKPGEIVNEQNDSRIPWLCLLVFKEGEIDVYKSTQSSLKTIKVADFFDQTDEDSLKPEINRDSIPLDILASSCSYISIKAEVFQALAPKIDELRYLAHVRQVDISAQAISDTESGNWFSVISGNRLLKTTGQAGQRFYVHLVSLEGYYNLMKDYSSWPKQHSTPERGKNINLISLYNWSFLSQPETLNFKQLVENFAEQSKKTSLLRIESQADNNQVFQQRLKMGSVPMRHDTASGEKTIAWYRSPLVPVVVPPLPRPDPGYHFPSAASLMNYDSATGLFDQTYAAAWSMGRALALADVVFSQSLLRLRRKSYAVIGKLMDRLPEMSNETEQDFNKLINSSAVRDAIKNQVSGELGSLISAMMTNPDHALNGQFISDEQIPANKSIEKKPVELIKQFLSSSQVQVFLKEEIKTDLLAIAEWLARKQALYDVPFNHLVPEQSMLPVESLRFFYLDQNWLDVLVDGALSIGMQTSKDAFYTRAMRGILNDAIATELQFIRDKLMGSGAGDTDTADGKNTMCGILLRSSVVSGWPGLAVKAYKGNALTGQQLKTIRMERLSPSVLLCIFLDIPDTITLAEPSQGLCFGVEDDNIIQLRKLTESVGKPTGINFPDSGSFASFFRSNTIGVGDDVLNINDGKKSLVQTMTNSQNLDQPITPGQFALQMVKAPEAISFISKTSFAGDTND
ncbi:hypothetical protein [Thalassotalea fusca]